MRVLIFVLSCVAMLAGSGLHAETVRLDINGQIVNVPVPRSYEDATHTLGWGPDAAFLVTKEIEEWERINEFTEATLVYGFEFGDKDPAVIQHRFDAFFASVANSLQADIVGLTFTLNKDSVSEGAFEYVMKRINGGSKANVLVVENTPTQKGVVFDTGFVMPGVITYPLVEDFSMVLVDDRMVMIHSQRVVFDASVKRQAAKISQRLRNGISRAN